MPWSAAVYILMNELDDLARANAHERSTKINALAAKLRQLNADELSAIENKIFALPGNVTGHLKSIVMNAKRKLDVQKKAIQKKTLEDEQAIEKAQAASQRDVNKTAIGRVFDSTEVAAGDGMSDLSKRSNKTSQDYIKSVEEDMNNEKQ